MKYNLLLSSLLCISFRIQGMERLAALRALPVEEGGQPQTAISLPNLPSLSPNMLLKLSQKPANKAQLELPLLEAKIRYLEKKHTKDKKAFNEKHEKVLDQGMYGAGFLALSLFMDYTKKEIPLSGSFFFGEFNASPIQIFKYSLEHIFDPYEGRLQFVDWGRVVFYGATILALKNITQAGMNYYKLPAKPQEPQELIEARHQKAQLLLTLQQSE